MTAELPKVSRDFLEVESLKAAKEISGCGALQAVKIALAPPGAGPNWYVLSFIPELPPDDQTAARRAILPLTGRYALMGD
jgi:hypothetical protein